MTDVDILAEIARDLWVGPTDLVAIIAVNGQLDGGYDNTVAVTDGVHTSDPRAYASPGAVASPLGETLLTRVASFVRRALTRVNPADVSKVVDGNGTPPVVYHGSNRSFNVFRPRGANRNAGGDTVVVRDVRTADAPMIAGSRPWEPKESKARPYL